MDDCLVLDNIKAYCNYLHKGEHSAFYNKCLRLQINKSFRALWNLIGGTCCCISSTASFIINNYSGFDDHWYIITTLLAGTGMYFFTKGSYDHRLTLEEVEQIYVGLKSQ